MYTNILTEEGLATIEKYLYTFKEECYKLTPLGDSFNIPLILALLKLVMTTNVFMFGDTWWLQQMGTAMGTPVACIYATLFFAYFERTTIIPKYKSNLLYYGRQIDDILIIWHPTEPNLTFTDFYNDLNNQCNLSWTTSQLQQSVNFLDLTISINPITNTISTKTYYKPMHLFNYIPPHSAQAPGILKSLIYGLFQCYYHQNTSHLDFLSNIKLQHSRLVKRGHDHNTTKKLIVQCANNFSTKLQHPIAHHVLHHHNHINHPDTQLLFHIPYHPRDISRQRIHNFYESTCTEPDDNGDSLLHGYTNKHGGRVSFSKLTLSYSRPKNLRDHLCPSKLTTKTSPTGCSIPDPLVSLLYKSSYLK